MNKKLESIGNFLEKNFDFHNILLLKKFHKIKKIIDVLDKLNINFFTLQRGVSPFLLITKLNKIPKENSNYKQYLLYKVEFNCVKEFNFETLSFSKINNETSKNFVITSSNIVLYDTFIYGKKYFTRHLREVHDNQEDNLFCTNNFFNSNTKYTYTFQNSIKNNNFFDTEICYKIFYYSN